jgi:hypothetical protein
MVTSAGAPSRRSALERFDLARQPLRQRCAAPADADECELIHSSISWANRTNVRSISDALITWDLSRVKDIV